MHLISPACQLVVRIVHTVRICQTVFFANGVALAPGSNKVDWFPKPHLLGGVNLPLRGFRGGKPLQYVASFVKKILLRLKPALKLQILLFEIADRLTSFSENACGASSSYSGTTTCEAAASRLRHQSI